MEKFLWIAVAILGFLLLVNWGIVSVNIPAGDCHHNGTRWVNCGR